MKRILLTDAKPAKRITVSGQPEDRDAEAALRAIREKVDAIGSNLDRSVAALDRLERKLGDIG
jgi:hypothetical protein